MSAWLIFSWLAICRVLSFSQALSIIQCGCLPEFVEDYLSDHANNAETMPDKFHSIGLIGKQGTPNPRESLVSLIRFLQERGHNILLEQGAAERLPDHNLPVATLEEIGRWCQLAIVVGGDGTLLHAARSLADDNVPVLGINLGRLGFLADISPDEMINTLEQIFSGHYQKECRFLLSTEINGQHHTALNDVVIHKWNIARMIEFETYVDSSFVDAQRSDGLIISTPTGSSAYALSGGGPLIHPNLNATLLVPICPHTLSNRPIVISGESQIEIQISCHTEIEHIRITCDGQTSLPLESKRILIRKHERPVCLIHPENHDHFNILRAKLGWGEHPI